MRARRLLAAAFLLVLFSATPLWAQDASEEETKTTKPQAGIEIFDQQTQKKPRKTAQTTGIAFEKEFSVGGKMTTTGWSFFGEYARQRSLKVRRIYQIEFMEIKHPKQRKQSNEFTLSPFGFDSPKSFVYGKRNNFYTLHLGYGNKMLLGDKAEKSGIEINFAFTGGFALGMAKPYYLNIIDDGDSPFRIVSEKYNPEEPERFLESTRIYGSSGFSYGLGEINIIPGVYMKSGINFDWATASDFVKQIEAGVGADLYFKDVPIMIVENNKPYYVYLYLSLQLGKKW